jgi:hypothetical protein
MKTEGGLSGGGSIALRNSTKGESTATFRMRGFANPDASR